MADAIEATQILFGRARPVLFSPDGERYVVVLQRGDITRNGSWIQLITGGTSSLETAARFGTALELFTRSTAQVEDLIGDLHWLPDSKNVAFLWDDGNAGPQIVKVNVQSHEIKRLTRTPSAIVSFDASGDASTIVYAARVAHDSSSSVRMLREGFAVVDQHLWSLLDRSVDGWRPNIYRSQIFAVSPGHSEPRKIVEDSRWRAFGPSVRVAPDGRFACADQIPDAIPASWDRYRENMWFKLSLAAARQPGSPNNLSLIRQLFIIDLTRGTVRPLWNAPMTPAQTVVWSPDSRRVVVGPAFLPSDRESVDGVTGTAVAEIDIGSGAYAEVPVPAGATAGGRVVPAGMNKSPLSWNENDVIELGNPNGGPDRVKVRLQKTNHGWQSISSEPKEMAGLGKPVVRIEVRQSLNSPPSLVAVDARTKEERVVLATNPNLLDRVSLGRAELVHWTDAQGEPWSGVLYYPVHYGVGKRFPLVIQTHGFNATEFSLSGSFTTAYAAQPLAGRDIAVLQMGGPDLGLKGQSPEEPKKYILGWEGAVGHFAARGLVDPARVGIIGFSRAGWHVEYALTHSAFSYAAAIVADNIDDSYLQYLTAFESLRSETEAENGGAPYGDGLQAWLRNAPGFNTDKIHTPLRLERDSGGVSALTSLWEMFSHLRHQHKPVELFVIPDVEHGVHILQNPAQRMASQGGTVDWMDFWLNEHEDPNPKKAEQYARWRKLRDLHEADLKH